MSNIKSSNIIGTTTNTNTTTTDVSNTTITTAVTTTTTTPSSTAATSSTTTTTTNTMLLPNNDPGVIQAMIDISAHRLEGLRTKCATSATLTQQEIRSLETKLVRMFSELLITKARLEERIPSNTTGNELQQWLHVVGLSQETINICLTRLTTLEQLLEQSDNDLKQIITNNPNYREEEVRRLTKAMKNLHKCKNALSTYSVGNETNENKEQIMDELFWDSWDRHTPQHHHHHHYHHHNHHHHHHRGSVGNIGMTTAATTTSSSSSSSPRLQRQKKHYNNGSGSGSIGGNSNRQSPSSSSINDNSNKSNLNFKTHYDDRSSSSVKGSSLTLTLTPSPPNSPITPTTASNFNNFIDSRGIVCGGGSLNGTPQRTKLAGTPPPIKKHQTLLSNCQSMTPTHHIHHNNHHQHHHHHQQQHYNYNDGGINLPLSKSKSNESQFQDSNSSITNSSSGTRSRLHTDPSPDSYSSASSEACIENNNNPNNLQVPRSPCTPIVTLGMGHAISHRFTKVFKMISTCDLCQKQMFFGLKCKECKYRCHKDCEPNVPPSCGLPREFVDEFKKTLKDQGGFSALSHVQTNATTVNTSPNLNTLSKNRNMRRNITGSTGNTHHHPDSSSPGSSCNSSSPSSPALFNLQHHATSHGSIGGNIGTANVYMSNNSNIMSSSGGGSSSTSSNMLSTPSSFQKNASQFNFPDVTITSNCNQAAGNSTTQTLYSSQTSGSESGGAEYLSSPQDFQHDNNIDSTNICNSISNNINAMATVKRSSISDNETIIIKHDATASLVASISSTTNSISSTNNGSNIGTGSIGGNGNGGNGSISGNGNNHSNSNNSHSMTSTIISTSASTFYPRKLSSAGVDKRGPFTEFSDTHKSNDSDKTVSLSGSTSASTDSDRTPVRLDSTEDGDSGNWPRQNSLSLKEWDIPYGDLQLLEQIGKGRFGTVHRALWHGDVAVKLLKEDYLDDEHMLEAFRLEVANFKKTRHENLVLFMGACMNPPYLAIVTSLCKGNTLYTYIHLRRDKFAINRTTLVAQQISQGMGYLHARGIYHKDLRTKNIFLENGKVIITDFGLFSSTKLLYCDIGLGIPSGWLCYLSPELMRALLPRKPTDEILPFSKASDVYSFGTVWYELLCSEFPFKTQPPESIIWQVGRGMKQTLANLQTSRDVKDILMLCWSFQADDRPDFSKLLTLLERLPKKRLARSPSHPVQLSRSAESVF